MARPRASSRRLPARLRMVDRPFSGVLLLCYLPAGLMEEEEKGECAGEHLIVPRVLEEPKRLLGVEQQRCRIDSLWLAPHAQHVAHEPDVAFGQTLSRGARALDRVT